LIPALFRVFIPSWRFFDELGEVSHLYYRFGADPESLGDWIQYSEKPNRHLGALFLNPRGNLHLANMGLISELPSTQELVENLVRFQIIETKASQFFFQFKAGELTSEIKEFPAP
jgi:hypothetical protein